MNEPICIARTRKPVELKLKAGEWVILCSPDGTFSDANAAFEKIGNLSENYNRVLIGKISHSRPSKNPFTQKENEARLAQVSLQDKKVQEVAAGAKDRANNVEKEQQKQAALSHQDAVKRKGELVDQIRKSTNYKQS